MDEIEIYNNGHSILKLRKEITVGGYTTFLVSVKNGSFSGEHSFCMSNGDIKSLIYSLKEIYKTLNGEIKITDCESTSFVIFTVDQSSVVANGELGIYFGDDFLRFKMKLDQTIIRLLYNCLNEFLNPAYYQTL